MSTCPVCGKGEHITYELPQGGFVNGDKVVHHLDCVLAIAAKLAAAEERVRLTGAQFEQRTRMWEKAKERVRELEDEIAGVHHYLLEMFEFFWHDGNSRTHLNVVEWLERPHTTPWMEAVNASEGRSMARLAAPAPKED